MFNAKEILIIVKKYDHYCSKRNSITCFADWAGYLGEKLDSYSDKQDARSV